MKSPRDAITPAFDRETVDRIAHRVRNCISCLVNVTEKARENEDFSASKNIETLPRRRGEGELNHKRHETQLIRFA